MAAVRSLGREKQGSAPFLNEEGHGLRQLIPSFPTVAPWYRSRLQAATAPTRTSDSLSVCWDMSGRDCDCMHASAVRPRTLASRRLGSNLTPLHYYTQPRGKGAIRHDGPAMARLPQSHQHCSELQLRQLGSVVLAFLLLLRGSEAFDFAVAP